MQTIEVLQKAANSQARQDSLMMRSIKEEVQRN